MFVLLVRYADLRTIDSSCVDSYVGIVMESCQEFSDLVMTILMRIYDMFITKASATI